MPPKPKFARREIVEAALDLVSRRGPEALTARNLGERLGSSARPIFTVFQGMDELRQEVRAAAMARFASYADRFKRAGVQMLLFAQEEPRLYQLLFVNGSREAASFADVFGELGPMAEHCVAAIRRDYALSDEDARLLFEHMWIYTFGLGTLCAGGARFSQERLQEMLSTSFRALLLLARAGRLREGGSCTES